MTELVSATCAKKKFVSEDELNRLLGFASRAATPRGFVTLDSKGNPEPGAQPVALITARMTHSFALGHMMTGSSNFRDLAELGVKSLNSEFRDSFNGGFTDRNLGSDLYPKELYLTSFVLLASTTGMASGIRESEELYQEALDSMSRLWDQRLGVFHNAMTADYGQVDRYIGANGNMHAVEALLASSLQTGDPGLSERALQVAEFFIHRHAKASGWMLPEHYSSDGRALPSYNVDVPFDEFRPYGVTPGHLFEWSRLLLELGSTLKTKPSWLNDASKHLYQAAKRYGWVEEPRPGFVYTVDTTGAPVVTLRPHWVLAEAIGAAATQLQAFDEDAVAEDLQLWQRHALTNYVDLEDGSWHHELDENNRPSHSMWSGKPDVYHALQASLIPQLPLAGSVAKRIRLGLSEGR